MAVVIRERCPQDHTCPCIRLCPVGAMSQSGFQAPEIDGRKCTDCGVCTDVCPTEALSPQDDQAGSMASDFL